MTEEEKIQAVWNKGVSPIPQEAANWRKDRCGAWIARDQYGNRNSDHGWEIDHIDPNGGDSLGNLQPLQWENNVAKSDGRLACVVKSDGNKNVKIQTGSAQ